jgi:hypothetical protein
MKSVTVQIPDNLEISEGDLKFLAAAQLHRVVIADTNCLIPLTKIVL